jgi:hypothetical protein
MAPLSAICAEAPDDSTLDLFFGFAVGQVEMSRRETIKHPTQEC